MNMLNQQTRTTALSYDEGLRSHFRSVYNTMSLGLMVTGLVAYAVAAAVSSSPEFAHLLFNSGVIYAFIFAPLLFLFFGFSHRAVMNKTAGQLKTLFYAFSAVWGVSLSTIFLAYTGGDIVRAFFVTSATFAAMSIFGYTTKIDLGGLRSFLMMGVIGLLIAIVVNLFMQSTMMDFIISCAAVLIYTLLTAYDTQNIKESYSASYGDEANKKMAVMGALSLYINFMVLFQFILQFLGNRD